jgi:hypothetical protein
MARQPQPTPSTSRFHVKWRPVIFLVPALLVLLLIIGSYRLEVRADSLANGSDRLQHLQLAQLVRPLSPRLHAKITRFYLESGDLKSAVTEINRPLAPQGKIRHQVGAYRAFAENNDSETARLLAASKRDRTDRLDRRLEAFLALPDVQRAAALAPEEAALTETAKTLSTTEPSRLLYSSTLLFAYQLPAPAHRLAAELTERYPALPLGWRHLATLQLAENNPKAALRSLERAEALFPTAKETHRLKAEAYRASGDVARAAAAEAKAESLR